VAAAIGLGELLGYWEPTMSKDIKSKVDPKKKDTKISSPDDLTKTNKTGDIELDEEELKRVSGGFCASGKHL
jgi:hypothetical protein